MRDWLLAKPYRITPPFLRRRSRAMQVLSLIIAGLMLCAPILCFDAEKQAVRIGLIAGTVKVGCYVWDTKECGAMLGLDSSINQSKYGPDKTKADWYIEALGEPLEREVLALHVNAHDVVFHRPHLCRRYEQRY